MAATPAQPSSLPPSASFWPRSWWARTSPSKPTPADDIDNHARLARATKVPVATGEIEVGRWRFKQLLDAQAAMILQTDAAVCGGITEFRRIAATAASYGVTLSPHWFHDLHVHLLVAKDGRVLLPRPCISSQSAGGPESS
jgi:L-alanine-DL-glutamate epimerase-like enolase superfamily enzyme